MKSNGKERRRAAVMVNIEPSVYEILARHCNSLNCSLSSYVRALIFEGLRADGVLQEQGLLRMHFKRGP
jgi:hypothetical protein